LNKLERIKELLTQLEPFSLEVEDESYKHSNHYEDKIASIYPSHIKISITSSIFDGLSTLKRHKLINEALKPAFLKGLHAASIKAYSLEEME
jgi:BolA protein